MSHFSATLNSTADAFCDSWVSSTSHSQRKKSRRALFTKQSTKDSTNTDGNSKSVLRRQPIRRLALRKQSKHAHKQGQAIKQASLHMSRNRANAEELSKSLTIILHMHCHWLTSLPCWLRCEQSHWFKSGSGAEKRSNAQEESHDAEAVVEQVFARDSKSFTAPCKQKKMQKKQLQEAKHHMSKKATASKRSSKCNARSE